MEELETGMALFMLFVVLVLALAVGGFFSGWGMVRKAIAARKGTRENAYVKRVFAKKRGTSGGRIPLVERVAGKGGQPEGASEADGEDLERLGAKTRRILGGAKGRRVRKERTGTQDRGLQLRARGHFRMP